MLSIFGVDCTVIAILNKYRYFLPTSVMLVLYKSLFYSHLCYAHLVRGTTNPLNIKKLCLLQKKALRAIANMSYFHSALPYCYKYRIQDVLNIFLSAPTFDILFRSEKQLLFIPRTHWPYTIHISPYNLIQRNVANSVISSRTNFGHQRLKHTILFILNYVIFINVDLMALNKKHITDIVI